MSWLTLEQQIRDWQDYSENPQQRIRTGFDRVDEICGGPAPGETFMVLGRSFTGKSLVAQNIIIHNKELPSIFFSLEMPYVQALQRMYSMWSGTPNSDVHAMTEAGSLPKHIYAMAEEMPYHHIVDQSAATLKDMTAYVRRFTLDYNVRPAFVVIDYLELLGGVKTSGEGWGATEAAAAKLKDWAKQENLPVFIIHQTNKLEPDWRPPTKDSAKGAGYTECDFVMGMWQPGQEPGLPYVDQIMYDGIVNVNVLKNRAYGRLAGGKGVAYKLESDLTFRQLER